MRHEVDDETRRELFEDDDGLTSRGGDERRVVEWCLCVGMRPASRKN